MERMVKPLSQAWIAARHEAAHVVVGFALGIGIRGASIRRGGRREWNTDHESLQEHQDRESARPYRELVRDHAVLAMAGSAMEFLLTGDETVYQGDNTDDWNTVHDLLNHELRLGRVELDAERDALWARAKHLVAQHRRSVDRIADVLDHVGEISGPELERLAQLR